jgi:lipid A disaccharide synthetase
MDKPVVKELIQNDLTVENLKQELSELLLMKRDNSSLKKITKI